MTQEYQISRENIDAFKSYEDWYCAVKISPLQTLKIRNKNINFWRSYGHLAMGFFFDAPCIQILPTKELHDVWLLVNACHSNSHFDSDGTKIIRV